MSRIRTEPTGLPSGGFYALVDGVMLHAKQRDRYVRVFQSEYLARRAARRFLRERERAAVELARAPYPFCRHPAVCAPKGTCQRDPNCCD